MPQINQLADVAFSQFFWLLLVLGLIYFGIGRAMLPKIQSTVEARDRQVADDIDAAQAAREAADAIEAAYRGRLDESRAQAQRIAAEAKAASAKANEQRIGEANAETAAAIDAAEERIRSAAESALGQLEKVAAEAARDMAERLAGVTVSKDEAARAVKATLADG